MFTQKCAARRGGFTLIELLIVIVVIAILALIVIPRLMSAGDRARAATYHENLNQLIKGIEAFKNDCGVYPQTSNNLADLYATTAPTTGEDAGYTAAQWHGPYLLCSNQPISATILLPVNPYVTQLATPTFASNWTYSETAASGTTQATYSIAGAVLPPSGY